MGGENEGSGIGVYGSAYTGVAVQGYSTYNDGVLGSGGGATPIAFGGNGVHGVTTGKGFAGVYGEGQGSYPAAAIGVVGVSSTSSVTVPSVGYGMWAQSDNNDGIHGKATNGTNAGVSGEGASGSIGVYGSCAKVGTTECFAGKFAGDVNITGCLKVNGTATQGTCASSDRRLKRNITPLQQAVEKLLQLKGVNFEWIDPKAHDDQTGTQTGLLAQDVKKVFPQWVGEDGNGYLTLNIDPRAAFAVIVEAFREQQDEIEELKKDHDAHRPVVTANWGIFGGMSMIGLCVYMGLRRKRDDDKRS